jgi:hypothetical protein
MTWVIIEASTGLTSGGGECSGEETSFDRDWLMTLLGRAGISTKVAVDGGVSKTVCGLRAGWVSGRPWVGNERIGEDVLVRRGGWEVGERAAKIALRVLIAEA